MDNGIIKLHGREYKTVALRVHEFRIKHPIEEGWGLASKIIQCDDQVIIFRAAIVDPQGREVAIGYAEERRTNRGINSTSALEVCETSALGRALAAAGYGGSEYASADELASAIGQQRDQAPQPRHHPSWTQDHKAFLASLKEKGLIYEDVASYCEKMDWGHPSSWTAKEREEWLDLHVFIPGVFVALYRHLWRSSGTP